MNLERLAFFMRDGSSLIPLDKTQLGVGFETVNTNLTLLNQPLLVISQQNPLVSIPNILAIPLIPGNGSWLILRN